MKTYLGKVRFYIVFKANVSLAVSFGIPSTAVVNHNGSSDIL